MSEDDPKKRSGGSRKFAEHSRRLQLYSSLREVVNRLNELVDRIGQMMMGEVEPPPSTPVPPPPTPAVAAPSVPRPSVQPTAMHQAVTPRSYEDDVRTRFSEADTEAEREYVRQSLRRVLDTSPAFAEDEGLRALEAELRKR